jgi:hypothetical protein
MKSAPKQISFMIFVLIINLIWANSSFDKAAFIQYFSCNCNECQDSSDPSASFPSIYCEDDVCVNHHIVKSNRIEMMNDKVLLSKVIIPEDYLNKIWQPPKFIL